MMTAEELTEILTGTFADYLGYQRAFRHRNTPASLAKMLAKDGQFLYEKCRAYRWDEATPDELHLAARWMVTNDENADGFEASKFVENPNTAPKTLRYLFNNVEDSGYLWSALLINPNTPDNIRSQNSKKDVQGSDSRN